MPGFEPGAAGWEASTLSIEGPNFIFDQCVTTTKLILDVNSVRAMMEGDGEVPSDKTYMTYVQ